MKIPFILPFYDLLFLRSGARTVCADSLGWDKQPFKNFRFASVGEGRVSLPAPSAENSPPQDVKQNGLVP
jgi:hypothetical protein